ncbi:hypothetical protein KIPB_000316 [Kipferlia bialata]|uniref:Uncharacterized protein n=1 Tax=Kipferlia bialata TaxID=797122 RepID=A0A9K3CMC7_9EUKA|nr:hypothetical protein KIPB_000316 [Kipferlia bialata]|eukprot:g316.t1
MTPQPLKLRDLEADQWDMRPVRNRVPPVLQLRRVPTELCDWIMERREYPHDWFFPTGVGRGLLLNHAGLIECSVDSEGMGMEVKRVAAPKSGRRRSFLWRDSDSDNLTLRDFAASVGGKAYLCSRDCLSTIGVYSLDTDKFRELTMAADLAFRVVKVQRSRRAVATFMYA